MRVLHLSTWDISGGAARAAYRLHRSLITHGVDSKMLVLSRSSSDSTVIPIIRLSRNLQRIWAGIRCELDALPCRLYTKRDASLSVGWLPVWIGRKLRRLKPDIINLHWVSGFISVRDVAKFNTPVVWTLHDMAPFTGGCHYAGGCSRHAEQCGLCPNLGSERYSDLSEWTWQRKKRHWAGAIDKVISPSRWLATAAQQSSLFRDLPISVVPYGVDTDTFRPQDPGHARAVLGLPPGTFLILFGAMGAESERKGWRYLREAVDILARSGDVPGFEIVIFGNRERASFAGLSCRLHFMGVVDSESEMARLYAAVDLYVLPSLADNLPNTLLEAVAVGTPCVSFDVGGCPDVVRNDATGFIARTRDSADLACQIRRMLVMDENGRQRMRDACRGVAEREYTLKVQAERYMAIYESVRKKPRSCPDAEMEIRS